MRSRDLRAALLAVGFLVVWVAVILLVVAAIPGSSITAAGPGTNTQCGAAQTLFSTQNCNIPTLAGVSDEFNSPSSAANWTVVTQRGSPTNSAAFEPYVLVPGANRYTFGGWRDGWFSTQFAPSATGGVRQALAIYRDYAPTNTATLYVNWSQTGPVYDPLTNVFVGFVSTASTVPDSVVGAGCRYWLATSTLSAWDSTAGNTGATQTDTQPLFTTLIVHRRGNQYWCWGQTDDGRAVYVGTRTLAFTPARVWLAAAYGEQVVGNGSPIWSYNYVRVVENQRFIP